MSEQKQEQERTQPLPPNESSRYAWAEKDIEYARKYYRNHLWMTLLKTEKMVILYLV